MKASLQLASKWRVLVALTIAFSFYCPILAGAQPYQARVEDFGSMRMSRGQQGNASIPMAAPAPPPGYSQSAALSGLTSDMFAAPPPQRASVAQRLNPPMQAFAVHNRVQAPVATAQPLTGSVAGGLLKSLLGGTGLMDASPFSLGASHSVTRLNVQERNTLSNSDVVIVLDHSGSMKTRDCPGGMQSGMLNSRLGWATDEMQRFADEITSALPHGFTLITFDDQPETFHINNASELRYIMSNLRGGGGTKLDRALQAALAGHEQHRNQPLVIAVVTDAQINVGSAVNALVDATNRYPLPNGVFVTLLQVGGFAQIMNSRRMQTLENLPAYGAKYPVYTSVPFSQLRSIGFGRGIIGALRH